MSILYRLYWSGTSFAVVFYFVLISQCSLATCGSYSLARCDICTWTTDFHMSKAVLETPAVIKEQLCIHHALWIDQFLIRAGIDKTARAKDEAIITQCADYLDHYAALCHGEEHESVYPFQRVKTHLSGDWKVRNATELSKKK